MRRNMLPGLVLMMISAALPPSSMAGETKAQTHHGTGTVKSVNIDKGTMVLAHAAIQSLNWPAMTMNFKAKDKALLEKVKPGADVEFSFVQSGKDYVVTDIR